MQTVQSLIDKASERCGGLRRLADAIDENASYLSNARNGKKPISPGVAARIAEIAGMDARVIALQTLVSQEKDHAKAVALAMALGVEVPPMAPTRNGVTVQLACTYRTTKKKIASLFRRLDSRALGTLRR